MNDFLKYMNNFVTSFTRATYMKRFFLIACLLIFCINASAIEHYYFKQFGSEDGMPNNTITCSTQDHFGFLWFGTKDGICRYNGHDFTFIEDPVLNNCINGMTFSLCEDHNSYLWCSTTNGIGYYNLLTGEITGVDELNGILITEIKVDKSNNVWFISASAIIKFDRATEKYVRYATDRNFSALHSCIDHNGTLWFTTHQGLIYRYNSLTDDFETFRITSGWNQTAGTYPIHITSINDKQLLLSTNRNDLLKVNVTDGSCTLLAKTEYAISDLLARTETEYWAGTVNGLVIYNDLSRTSLYIDGSSLYSLSNNNINTMLEDREGNVWLGSYYGGLNVWYNKENSVTKIFYTGGEGTFYGKMVHALTLDKQGNLWAGTEDGQLNQILPLDKRVICYSNNKDFPQQLNIHCLLEENNKLWMATFNDGLYFFNLDTKKIDKHIVLGSNQCVCMLKMQDNTILVGTSAGLYRYDRQTDDFVFVEGTGRRFIHALFQDSRGTLWVGTYGSGILYSRDNMASFDAIQAGVSNNGLESNFITCFFEDDAHMLWIGTEGGGLCKTRLESPLSFTHYTRNDGLPSNITCAITQDNRGQLWVSTSKGLAQIELETGWVMKVYLDNNGLVGNQFMYNSLCHLPSGRIAMGTINGMISINPDKLVDPINTAPLYFQDIHTGKDVDRNNNYSAGKSVVASDKIRVKQVDAAYLSITYTALNYSNISVPKYEYTLSKGGRQMLKTVTLDNTVVFADMHPGHYNMDVKVVGSTSSESHKSLSIVVVPPFYKSVVAYIVYCLLLALAAFFLVRLLLRKRSLEQSHHLEQMEAMKQQEISDAKINFFTNITHEIRTPLSLIKMPIDKIIAQKEYTEASKEDIMTIKSNTNRLLELTNQLLDIRKMENNQISVHFLKEDICALIRHTADYFATAAEEQHIAYTVDIPETPLMVMCAADIIKKIVSNLLSNAIKYGKDSVGLSLTLSEEYKTLEIRVTSNGDLISGEDREKIFTPFYQIKSVSAQLKGSNGTGLGLPYARELAHLHKGSLVLDPEVRDANSFVFTLPLDLKGPTVSEADLPDNTDDINVDSESDNNRHSLLVVEDAAEMRHYLAKELGSEYNVFTASNGEEGVEVINTQKIDLVVSDIMMPIMDGCQLCNYVKNNVEYSHIPVILLTAAVGVETRIETLEVGADGYIEKPFIMELLQANISNLFKNREIANRQFANSPLSHFNSVSANNVEKAFMDKLHATIMQHMAEQDLGIDSLTTILGTSKSTLYRKIKANTGLNTNEYIRLCRLKKAAEMLSSQEYRINEVAYLVGFSSPSYFTTSFQKQFNISPSAFIKNLKVKE